MTEQPDTAAIRARCEAWGRNPDALRADIRILVDALDAARAERDTANDAFRLKIKAQLFPGDWMPWKARAEAAEAELAEEARNHLDDIRLLQTAEARIANALAEECHRPHAEGCCGCPVHAALAGGGE